jgi:hypothetical protein
MVFPFAIDSSARRLQRALRGNADNDTAIADAVKGGVGGIAIARLCRMG